MMKIMKKKFKVIKEIVRRKEKTGEEIIRIVKLVSLLKQIQGLRLILDSIRKHQKEDK